MKLQSLKKWELNQELEGLLFFAQRLDELLFDYTLDSYKPSALNPPSLCREALEVIDAIEEGSIREENIVHVSEELLWAIRRDIVSKSLLDVPLESYVLLSNETPMDQKRIRLEVLSQTLEPRRYLERCEALLVDAVVEGRKRDISHLSRMLITTLVNLGVNKSFLYWNVKNFFFAGDEPKIDSPTALVNFFQKIEPTLHHFEIFFIVSDQIKSVAESIRAFGLEIVDDLPDPLKEFAAGQGFAPSGSEVIVEVHDVEEFDRHSAREEAERRLDGLRDFFTLYFHSNELVWKDSALIDQCCEEVPMIVSSPKSAMSKAFDMKPQHASRELNKLLRNLALRLSGSFSKFRRIVDLHGICVSNEVPENQLLNLWISLETLVPSTSGRTTIGTLVGALEPFVRLTYIQRLIDRATFDLTIWSRTKTRHYLRKAVDAKGERAPVKLLHILALPQHQEVRDQIYADLEHFHLLRFRLFQLANVLQSASSVTDMLDEHVKKVRWQLHRLYRTRNLLVHSARTPSYLGTLIENGHDYLDTVLNRITTNSCGPYQIRTFEQGFELERILCQKLDEFLRKDEVFSADNIGELYCG